MTAHDYLNFIVDEIHSTVVATVDSDCPQSCIKLNGKAVIRQENCLHCGNCAEVCPVGAVIRR